MMWLTDFDTEMVLWDLQYFRVHYLNYQQHIPKKDQHVKWIKKDFKTVQQNGLKIVTYDVYN